MMSDVCVFCETDVMITRKLNLFKVENKYGW